MPASAAASSKPSFSESVTRICRISLLGFKSVFRAFPEGPSSHNLFHFSAGINSRLGKFANFFDGPNMARDSGSHRRSDSQCLMDATKIVVHEVDRDWRDMILIFLRNH